MPLHLGPLGALHTMRAPAAGIPIDYPRQGGTHQALSGARTLDFLGTRGTYELTWTHLRDDEADYLLALRDRHVSGPLRMILDGWRRNRLSRSAASVGYGGRDMTGVGVTAGAFAPSDFHWPLEARPPGRGLTWTGYVPDAELQLDTTHPVPQLAGETLTVSVSVYPDAADTVRLVAAHWTYTGYDGATAGQDVTLTAGQWHRLTLTVPHTPGVWGLCPILRVITRADAASALNLAAAQVETGSEASAWQLGGGSPVVAVDDAPLTLPYAGRVSPELHLVEL